MSNTVTILQIAAALGVDRSSAVRRAAKEAWAYEEECRAGKPKRLYFLKKPMPLDVQRAVSAYLLQTSVSSSASPEVSAGTPPALPWPGTRRRPGPRCWRG